VKFRLRSLFAGDKPILKVIPANHVVGNQAAINGKSGTHKEKLEADFTLNVADVIRLLVVCVDLRKRHSRSAPESDPAAPGIDLPHEGGDAGAAL
jgi:hypothetical protein